MKERYNLPCNIAQTLNIIGDRWTLLILHDILVGRITFNEIKKSLEGISSKLLSERLKYLEANNLITSTMFSTHPPRYKYEVTESGKDLDHVFYALIVWGEKHLDKCYKKVVHRACQHEVEIAYYCPHCGQNHEDLEVIPAGE